MKWSQCILFPLLPGLVAAQHCPWDCTGLVQFKIEATKVQIEKMNLVLVDEEKNEVIDTLYGTGKNTYDTCKVLFYDDFILYRTQRIATHHGYSYDTVYYFAKDKYLARYNFCKYENKRIYLRFSDRYSRSLRYHFIEIPATNRVHLHQYNEYLQYDRTSELKELLGPFVLNITCDMLGLRKEDCIK